MPFFLPSMRSRFHILREEKPMGRQDGASTSRVGWTKTEYFIKDDVPSPKSGSSSDRRPRMWSYESSVVSWMHSTCPCTAQALPEYCLILSVSSSISHLLLCRTLYAPILSLWSLKHRLITALCFSTILLNKPATRRPIRRSLPRDSKISVVHIQRYEKSATYTNISLIINAL